VECGISFILRRSSPPSYAEIEQECVAGDARMCIICSASPVIPCFEE
jgi:hypothetical protein